MRSRISTAPVRRPPWHDILTTSFTGGGSAMFHSRRLVSFLRRRIMPRKKCVEKRKNNTTAENAVWVANENGNQLYYPSVHTCVTVTLVFENGLLGGHASQVPPMEKADPQP